MITIDPNSYLLLSGTKVLVANNLSGIGHEPKIELNYFATGTTNFVFSGSSNYQSLANSYLHESSVEKYGPIFSCTSTSWSPWTIATIFKFDSIPSVESGILTITSQLPQTFPSGCAANSYVLFMLYASSANICAAAYSDSYANCDSAILHSIDTDQHVVIASANGSGTIDIWFDGAHSSFDDVRPKTACSLTLGCSWGITPSYPMEQFNGKIGKTMIYNRVLTQEEREALF